MTIWLDMDGTIADLYSVENWLPMLIANDPTPYYMAKPLMNLSLLARLLHQVQANGHEIGIISWLSKNSNPAYDMAVAQAKMTWLMNHLPSVKWNYIKIVPYGTPKHELCAGILFDDEKTNRDGWGEGAYTPDMITEILKGLR